MFQLSKPRHYSLPTMTKFPYLEKEKYEIWAHERLGDMDTRMLDHYLLEDCSQGNSPKRENKGGEPCCFRLLPEVICPFSHYDDAKGYLDGSQGLVFSVKKKKANTRVNDRFQKIRRQLIQVWFVRKAGRTDNYNLSSSPARFDRRKKKLRQRTKSFGLRLIPWVNWSDHAAENTTGEVEKFYGMMAGLHADSAECF
ncbi:hypothetical protein Tco_0605243 [Tanacetum coccineum]